MDISPIKQFAQKILSPKTRSLNAIQYSRLSDILYSINKDIAYTSNGRFYRSNIIEKIHYKNSATLHDGRYYRYPTAKDYQMHRQSLLIIGNTELAIDNKTGEIVNYYKPFYMPWKCVMKKVDKYLKIFTDNYDNPCIIKREGKILKGLTKEGMKRVNTMMSNLNYPTDAEKDIIWLNKTI